MSPKPTMVTCCMCSSGRFVLSILPHQPLAADQLQIDSPDPSVPPIRQFQVQPCGISELFLLPEEAELRTRL